MIFREPKTLNNLFGHDLAGWKIVRCYYLERDHNLMGTFPAIDKDNRVIFVLDKGLLKKVWEKIAKQPAKITTFMVIVHSASGIAFDLTNCYGDSRDESLYIFSADEVEILCEEKKSIFWAPGLIQISERIVKDPVFT